MQGNATKVTTTEDRVESLIFVTVYTVLAVVLATALAVGGRDVMAASARRGNDPVSNITAAP